MRTLALASLLLGGCWVTCIGKRPLRDMHTKPDRVCVSGGAGGYNVYTWSCADGRHVVHYYFSGELVCGSLEEESAPCGQLTHFEAEHPEVRDHRCRPVAEKDW